MNIRTYEKISRGRPIFATPEIWNLREHFNDGVRLGIEILELFQDGRERIRLEVSKELGINYNTATTAIRVLRMAGCRVREYEGNKLLIDVICSK